MGRKHNLQAPSGRFFGSGIRSWKKAGHSAQIKNAPARPTGRAGTNGGGSSPHSLSRTGIGRLFGAAGFPTPFSTASGVSASWQGRPRYPGMLSEAFEPGATDGCATCPPTLPWQACNRLHARTFQPGQPPLLAARWPGTTGLASYLAGCIDCRPAVFAYRRLLEMTPLGAEPA